MASALAWDLAVSPSMLLNSTGVVWETWAQEVKHAACLTCMDCLSLFSLTHSSFPYPFVNSFFIGMDGMGFGGMGRMGGMLPLVISFHVFFPPFLAVLRPETTESYHVISELCTADCFAQ